jgi:hypothetical protein
MISLQIFSRVSELVVISNFACPLACPGEALS